MVFRKEGMAGEPVPETETDAANCADFQSMIGPAEETAPGKNANIW